MSMAAQPLVADSWNVLAVIPTGKYLVFATSGAGSVHVDVMNTPS